MRKGLKIYLLNFLFILFLLGLVFTLLNTKICENKTIFTILFLFTFIYMLFTWLGTVFRIGPLKVIGKGLLKDAEEAKEELKPKQPWD